MPPPTWDDDFDFDDVDNAPANKKNNDKKPKYQPADDFFEEEEATKLPAIPSRSSAKQIKPAGRSSATRKNPYAENMALRSNVYDDDEPFEQEIEEQKPKVSNKALPQKRQSQEYEFEEQIAEESPKKANNKATPKPPPPPAEDDYGEDFEEDYGEQFDEQVEETPARVETPVIRTEQPKKKSILNVPPPKPPSRKVNTSIQDPPKRNQSLAPGKDKNSHVGGIPRAPSRESIKSVSTQKAGARRNQSTNINRSRATTNNKIGITNSSFMPNKYSNQIDKQFPQTNLHDLNQDKLTKMNDRIRAMIKKFNDELNDLINKNMQLLKAKKNEKSNTVEDKLRVLEEQKKNNQTMIEYMDREFEKLTGREGELREEEYQLMTEKKIEQAKEKIKQCHKTIKKLKYEVKNEGNKLSKNSQDKKMSQQLHHLKTNLIQSKKDEEKQLERIEKLDEQSMSLNEKITDIEYQVSSLVDEARQKGIKLESMEELNKKFDDTRRRLEANRNHRAKIQHLLKSKAEIIAHEKEQLRISIKNCDMEIKNLYSSIDHAHGQSVKVVQKAKNNPKLGQNISADLEALLQSLQVNQTDNYSIRSQSNKSQHSHRPLKNVQIVNIEKSQPLRTETKSNQKPGHNQGAEDNGQGKPNLLKKKFKIGNGHAQKQADNIDEVAQKKNQVYERVWKQEEEEKKLQEAQKKEKEAKQQDKKKPFSLKKNRLSAQNKIGRGDVSLNEEQAKHQDGGAGLGLKLEDEPKKEEKKQDDKPSFAGPRMMKFKKRAQNAEQEAAPPPEEPLKIIQQNNPPPPPAVIEKQQQAKPLFVPKRFNLRRNQQKKEEDSYMPSMQAKKAEPEPKKQEFILPKKQEPAYQPKLDFGNVEDPFAKKKTENAYDPFAKKEEPAREKIVIPSLEEKAEDPEAKPRFNLRLRDRKKNAEEQNEGNSYLPKQEKKQEKVLNPYAPTNPPVQQPKQQPQEPINNPYNPYAQQAANPDAPLRRNKQGPLKKPKIQPAAQKQKINIYDQAEQPQGLNQFVPKEASPPKNQYSLPKQQKQPDLDDILGLKNKKKANDDFADLIGGGGGNKRAKKKNDFFGDMDL